MNYPAIHLSNQIIGHLLKKTNNSSRRLFTCNMTLLRFCVLLQLLKDREAQKAGNISNRTSP